MGRIMIILYFIFLSSFQLEDFVTGDNCYVDNTTNSDFGQSHIDRFNNNISNINEK